MRLKMKVFGLASLVSILTLAIGQYAAAIVNFDPGFGTGGSTITSFGANANAAGSGMALQPDGKLVLVGSASNGSNYDWKIARYNSNGSLDASFGSGGIVTRDFGSNDYLNSVAIQSDGKIVVGGYYRLPSNAAQWTVARYNSDGTPDLGFGVLGLATSFDASSYSSNLNGVAIQPDGKIVAVGYTNGPTTVSDDIALARYNADGSADTSFGTNGTMTVGLNQGATPNDRGNAVAIQPDGKLVVFGDYDTGQHRDNVVLARFTSSGSLDSSFGSGGFQTDNFSYHNGGRAVQIQPDGNIVVTGATCLPGGPCHTYVARYTTAGVRDTSFGSGGVTVESFSSSSESGNALALQPDGKIVVGGYAQNGSQSTGIVSRYNTDGSLDTSFGTNGVFTGPFGPNSTGLASVLLQPDGKIVVGGAAFNGSFNDWLIARIFEGTINRNPVVSAITVTPNLVQLGNAVTASASFTDDPGDTHTAVWDWGDGTTSAGTVTESNGSGSVSDQHTYAATGLYRVTLTVQDNRGGSGSSMYQYVSVYNPTHQGHFTGVHDFTSPTGAYAANPSLSGQATFDVHAQYKGTAATGTASLNFAAGNFSFSSDSITSLVINGSKATLTGTGSVNGVSGYTFFVTGLDGTISGQPMIRFQIMNGSTVVYDSQPGAPITADPTAAVTGQVVVHG